MMQTQTPPNAPPLPHLSGSPPVPQSIKRARVALTLSFIGVGMFFASLFVLITVGGGKGIFAPLNKQTTATVGVFLLVGSLVPSLTGFVMGILSRKVSVGKVAFITAGANLGLWLLLLCAAMLFEIFH